MNRRKIITVPIFLVFVLLSISVKSQVRVSKQAGEKNPKVHFKGIAGNPALSAAVASDLKNCGWFDLSSNRPMDYFIGGSAGGPSALIKVTHSNGTNYFSFKSRIDQQNIRKSAHVIVDNILKKMFGITGICSSKIAFTVEIKKGKKEIYVCDFDGKNLKRLTRNNSLSVEPDWTPGNKTLVYTLYSNGFTDIIEYDPGTRRSRRLAQYPGLNASAAVSPNGKLIALILSKDGKVELYLKTFGGKGLRRLTKDSSVEASPCWSPRGGKICFVSDRTRSPKLYVTSIKGGKANRLMTEGTEAVSPDWSKNNKIVYSAKMGKNYAVAVLDLTQKTPSGIVVSAAGDWECPSWAPDNRHVVCSRTLGRKSNIFVIDTWTGKTRKLLGGKYNLGTPSWSGN